MNKRRIALRIVKIIAMAAAMFGVVMLVGCKMGLKDFLNDPSYPQDYWQTATPEEVGLDSNKLIEGSRSVPLLHSMLVVKKGKLVFERYGLDESAGNHQLTPSEPQIVYSATKSITSALVGIALQEGLIGSIHDTALTYFPDLTPENQSEDKKRITIDDVLTMRSGLEWNSTDDDADASVMYGMYDSVQYVLNKPMVATPGTAWRYSTGNSQILAAMLHRVAHRTPEDYAREKIFNRLGITNFRWDADGKGTNFGGSRLYLLPRDMAKFGYLYLNRGMWEGTEVVPSSWVDASTQAHVSPPGKDTDYCYHWWRFRDLDAFYAGGALGQWIVVVPSEELVVVFTAALPSPWDYLGLRHILDDYVLGAKK